MFNAEKIQKDVRKLLLIEKNELFDFNHFLEEKNYQTTKTPISYLWKDQQHIELDSQPRKDGSFDHQNALWYSQEKQAHSFLISNTKITHKLSFIN